MTTRQQRRLLERHRQAIASRKPPSTVGELERLQLEACATYGCHPNVRRDGIHLYFAHDDWCGFVGGAGQ